MPDSPSSPPLVSASDIRSLIVDPRRLALVAQPIVDLRRGQIVGYEVLSRFQLDVPSPPDLVFAAATREGLGPELEATVIGRALDLFDRKPPNCFLTVNIDPIHVTSRQVRDVLGLRDLSGLVFELTEHREANDLGQITETLGQLRRRGAHTAVDDAGAGYSGLKQILELRPQFLKLDRALVAGVHVDEAKRAMIQMLGELAGRLDAWLLAEGIETESELHTLAQLGVPLGQGYFLARPEPPFCRLSPAVEKAFGAMPSRALSSATIANLVEPCASADSFEAWPADVSACVRLEGSGRPVAIRWLDDGVARERVSHELMRVKRGSTLSAVALRCAARTEHYRWDPLVCIDDDGRFEGLVPVHKLLWALASREHDPAPISTSYRGDHGEIHH